MKQFWANAFAPPGADDPRVRLGSSILFPVSIGHAIFVVLMVLADETGDAWPVVLGIAAVQFGLSLPLGVKLSDPRSYPYANVGLALLNFGGGAAIPIACGGYPTLMWMTSLFGVLPAAFFVGRAGAFINGLVAFAGMLIPHTRQMEATVIVGAGANALTVMVLGLVATPLFELVSRAEAKQREAAKELEKANADLELALSTSRREAEQKLLLNEMDDMIQSCVESSEALSILAGFGSRLFPDHAGALFTYRNSRDSLELAVCWGAMEPLRTQTFHPDDCWALRRGQPHLSDLGTPEANCRHIDAERGGNALCVPMMAQGEVLGVFQLRTEGQEKVDRTLAVTVARDGALGLANLRMRETLRNQALRDGLTQLFNRRYFDEALPREIHRALRRGQPLAVVMLDIDHFKTFNDTHGHAAGDLVLREVGAFLASHTRKEDLACRYGGEEFALVLPDTPLEAAIERAEALRRGLSSLRVQQDKRPLGRLTISAGVAAMPEIPAEDVVQVADSLLYRAKAEGRNRVIAAA